jgi:hypothetical protein
MACYLIFISYAPTSLWILQATDTRDALAKALYASLFEWLVEQINKSLSVGKRRTGRSISILDIYGFESFDVMYLPFDLLTSHFRCQMYSHGMLSICRRTVLNSSALIMPMRGYNNISTVICLSSNRR